MTSRVHVTTKGISGFGLVEVMVAMVIGMLGVIIMMEVFAAAEGQKRSTTGTGDAQNNGAMALYTLQRDIRQAGYGFNSVNVLGCALTLPNQPTPVQLVPALINPANVPARDDHTDMLLIAYGNNAGSPEGDTVTSAPTASGVMGVQSPTNFAVDDWVIAAPSAETTGCSLALAQVTSVVPLKVRDSGAVDGSALFNLGSSPRILAYAIHSGNLTVCDYMASDCSDLASYMPIASNIVSLRAEYGHASTATGSMDWDQAPPARACLWAKTTALRIAVVARNSQVDSGVLTEQAPVWEGSESLVPVLINLSGANGSDKWKHYRYKVFETVIPLRNLPWMESCP